jgi:hypothetical protein
MSGCLQFLKCDFNYRYFYVVGACIYRVTTETLFDFKNQNSLEYFYKYGTADTLTQEIFNFPARRQRAVKCKMALTSQQHSWCVLDFITT